MPGTLKPGDEPLWLTLQPSWRQMLVEFNTQNNVDILDCLQLFGRRMKHIEAEYVDNGVFFPLHEVFWHNEPDAEEGWATEYQVRPHCKIICSPNPEALWMKCLSSHILNSTLEVFSSHFPLRVWPHCPLLITFVSSKSVSKLTFALCHSSISANTNLSLP